MTTYAVTLPFLRIEWSLDASKPSKIHSPDGYNCLILGKIVLDEVPAGFGLNLLIRQAEKIQAELAMVRVDAVATRITVQVPTTMPPRILWPI